MAADLVGDTAGNRGRFDDVPDPRADRTQAFGVAGVEPGQLSSRAINSSLRCYGLRVCVGGDTETFWHPDSADPGELPEVGALASGQRRARSCRSARSSTRIRPSTLSCHLPAALRRSQRRLTGPRSRSDRSVRAVFLGPTLGAYESVAHPAWPAVLSAGEVIHFALSQVLFAADANLICRPMSRNRRWRHPARTGSVRAAVHVPLSVRLPSRQPHRAGAR